MKAISKSTVLMTAAAVLLGTAVAFSSVSLVSGASQIHSDKGKKSCKTSNYCLIEFNVGGGGAIEAGATSAYADAIYAQSAYGVAVQAYSDAFPLEASGAVGSFYTNGDGDGTFDGSVTAYGGYQTVIRTQGGARVDAGSTLAPLATIEDTGTARMSDGVGVVRLASDFARTLDLRAGYQVFLTPDGDTRGLYVAQKFQAGFIVRETQRGRSSLDFDYRIVAHPIGASEQRFPQVNIKRPPGLPASQ
jgi:hypothetical protein